MATVQVVTAAVKAETEQAVKVRGLQAGQVKTLENLLGVAELMRHLKGKENSNGSVGIDP